jgi:hypothetical protein
VRQLALFVVLGAQIGKHEAAAAVSEERTRELGIDLGHVSAFSTN